MDSIDLFKADVAAAGKTLARIDEVACATGIKPKTLRNIYYEETPNPRRNNLRRLDAYYFETPTPSREAA